MQPFLDKPHDTDRWMTIKELVDYLPGKPAIQTIYHKVAEREIPHVKEMGKLMFRKSEIDEWLKNKKRKTVAEVYADAGSNLKPRRNKNL